MATEREKRDPYLWEALISILALVTMISLAIVRYESDAHVPILIGVLVAALVGLRAGFSWKDIEKSTPKPKQNSRSSENRFPKKKRYRI
mgnify:CR=1 FL=1